MHTATNYIEKGTRTQVAASNTRGNIRKLETPARDCIAPTHRAPWFHAISRRAQNALYARLGLARPVNVRPPYGKLRLLELSKSLQSDVHANLQTDAIIYTCINSKRQAPRPTRPAGTEAPHWVRTEPGSARLPPSCYSVRTEVLLHW